MFHEEAQLITSQRILAVHQLLSEVESELSGQGWVSEHEAARSLTQALSNKLQSNNKEVFAQDEWTYFYGLRSLPAIGHGLLQVLSEQSSVFIDSSCGKPSAESTPNLFTSQRFDGAAYRSASDPLQECEGAIHSCAQMLLADASIAPKDLCIAVLDEKKFGDPLLELAEKHFGSRQIPFNHAIGSLKGLSPCFRYFESLKKSPDTWTWAEAISGAPEGLDVTPLVEGILQLDKDLLDQPLEDSIYSVLQILGETQKHPSGQALRGVQILRFSETRFLRFKKVFVLGADAKSLPSLSKPLALLSHGQRRLIDLPAPEEKLRLELCNLGDLLHNSGAIDFFYSKRSGSVEGFPSRLIEQIAGRPQALPHELGLMVHTENVPGKLQEWMPPAAPPLQEIAESLTPSKADQLLRCPARYYLQQKKIKPWEGHTDHTDARDEGEFLHKVLELTLKHHRDIDPVWSEWLRAPGGAGAADQKAIASVLRKRAEAVLRDQTAKQVAKNKTPLSDVFLLQLKYHSIPKWADFMTSLACLSMSPGFWRELETERKW